jgi:predicted RNA-binding Zn-ribbon protein involved in translation (DUF1610 family)
MTSHTDGNAIAGMLEEIFGREMTDTMRTCQSCGRERAIGAHRLYHGAGLVLRCPNCGDVAAVIVAQRVRLFGTWSEEVI